MKAISPPVDTDSKRWLTVLGTVALISTLYLVYSFLGASSEESIAAPPKPEAPPAEESVARAEPDWNAVSVDHTADYRATAATKPDPFADKYAADARTAAANDPVVRQKAVHRQADYFRSLIAQGKLPKGLGNLTKEQVDQMEKDGVLVN